VERVRHGVRACGWLPSEPVMMPHLVSCPFPLGYNSTVKIKLRNPSREVELSGRKRVKEVLRELDILPSTVLVIRGSDLLTADEVVGDEDVLEVRPVMSGGSARASASRIQ